MSFVYYFIYMFIEYEEIKRPKVDPDDLSLLSQ